MKRTDRSVNYSHRGDWQYQKQQLICLSPSIIAVESRAFFNSEDMQPRDTGAQEKACNREWEGEGTVDEMISIYENQR